MTVGTVEPFDSELTWKPAPDRDLSTPLRRMVDERGLGPVVEELANIAKEIREQKELNPASKQAL